MVRNIYLSKGLDRQLERLRKADKKGTLAAKQVEQIIDLLASQPESLLKLKHKQTKSGELRINNCRKYDLGSGYRLITIQDDDNLFLTYAGSHDACHQWLEKQRETPVCIKTLKSAGRLISGTSSPQSPEDVPPAEEPSLEPDLYEEELLSRIDEKTLQNLFKGLYQGK